MTTTSTFPEGFRLNPPATAEEIAEAEEALNGAFPNEYRDFLRRASGGEGPLGDESYLILWSAAELAEHNKGYKVDPEYAPDLVLIGTDGGNEVFAIRPADGAFVAAPLIGMSPEAVRKRGSTMQEFVTSFP
jgi:hypothetical protein